MNRRSGGQSGRVDERTIRPSQQTAESDRAGAVASSGGGFEIDRDEGAHDVGSGGAGCGLRLRMLTSKRATDNEPHSRESMDTLCFWGKARPRDPVGPRWHPLVFHALDVAAAGDALLTRQPGLARILSRLLGLRQDDACRLLLVLLCLHDIGKFAKRFQAKEPSLYPSCFDDDPAKLPRGYDHGAGGLRLCDALGPTVFRLPEGSSIHAWRPLISAVMGHHGSPPEAGSNNGLVWLRPEFGRAGIDAACAFIGQTYELLAPLTPFPTPDRRLVKPASYAVAGLAVLADWIGSNQEWFPYRPPSRDLDAYWVHARERADRAVDESGVTPATVRGALLHYEDLLVAGAAPSPITPSPMQRWAQTVELPAGPGLFLIEDETGSGKTEAALMLAHRLLESERAEGLYVALPTMATANAMFDRLAAAYRRLFRQDAFPSIALAHGARDMHAGFRAAMTRGGHREARYSNADSEVEASDTTASTACAAWIADDRRRAFLADVGAGTIDQALLSVLPNRHQSLRLLGLMRRVVVLDEVHAYDAYVQREIEALLEFQASLGGSVILLSATLPVVLRRRLVIAFNKGARRLVTASSGSNGPVTTTPDALAGIADMGYPLATLCAASVRSSTPVPGRPGRARTLPARFIRSVDDAVREVLRAARAERAVLYIRNTVDDALYAHETLERSGLAPMLFHARFVLADRLKIEKNVVRRFGKRGKPSERAGQVLVATQVVEQSLDLDFDVVISDLAPMDLLIQRAGRLWRHHRPERTGQPELVVVGPEPVADAPEDWFARSFPRARYVYRDHARLWLSARKLEETGVIDSPHGLRELIEAVYGNGAEARLPRSLRSSLRRAEDQAGTRRGIANTNTLKPANGFVRDGGAWNRDVRTPTRLADEPRVTLRLARASDGRIEPYVQEAVSKEVHAAWRLSEVTVSERRVGGERIAPEHVAAVQKAKATWTRFDEEKILVVFDRTGDDGALAGWAMSGDERSAPIRLGYDPKIGLTWL